MIVNLIMPSISCVFKQNFRSIKVWIKKIIKKFFLRARNLNYFVTFTAMNNSKLSHCKAKPKQFVFKNIFFPFLCCMCKQKSDLEMDLCSECLEFVSNKSVIKIKRCSRCGLEKKHFCKCITTPLYFDKMFVVYPFAYPFNKFIHNLKYQNKLYYGSILGKILYDNVSKKWYNNKSSPRCIVPVPIHHLKYRKRGFNQTHEILKIFNKTNFEVLFDYCLKIQDSAPQSTLSKYERTKNVAEMYEINKNKPINDIQKYVAIFDDVVTTMSTVNALSFQLKRIGVEKIDVWCICRA